MPLLGIGKKQEQKAEQTQTTDVPDELPDLPQDSSEETAPDELPPVDNSIPVPDDLAPDELPPVDGSIPEPDTAAEAPVDDQRLYFSSLLQKIRDEGLKSTKLSAPSANLLSDMKKHWKEQKVAAEREAMLKEVSQSITPLQKLEQEWVALQEDIEQKKKQLAEKEEKIRKFAEQAKVAAKRAERLAPVSK